MVDYKKFDDIRDSDSDSEVQTAASSASTIQHGGAKISPGLRAAGITKKGANGRLQFEHDGKIIYEWEQSLDEVNIYIVPPVGLPSNMIDVVISHRHVLIGLKGSPPFIDEDTGGPVKVKESMWTLTDGEININLQKMNKAEAWSSALAGKSGEEVDELTKEDIKKKLMIERFQEEVGNNLSSLSLIETFLI
jgi:CS domain